MLANFLTTSSISTLHISFCNGLGRMLKADRLDKNNAGSEFKRLNPPTFKGAVDLIVTDQWLQTMERMIEVAKVPEEETVTCVSVML